MQGVLQHYDNVARLEGSTFSVLIHDEQEEALQVVNKPLLNFTLETLQEQLGVKNFEILACHHSNELIKQLEGNM